MGEIMVQMDLDNEEFRKLFADTPWAESYVEHLRKVPNTELITETLPDGSKRRLLSMPLEQFLAYSDHFAAKDKTH